ncbi:hypothetical protein V8D89_001117 [Ganoderma adspersum]
MPAFSRVLVLSALAFAASVQSAPTGIIESRELGHVIRSAEPDIAPLEARHFRFPKLGSGDKGGEKSHHSGHGKRGLNDEDDAGPLQARRHRSSKTSGGDKGGEKSHHSGHHRRELDEDDGAIAGLD